MDFYINSRKISGSDPVFIIAELSANHNQNFDHTVKTIKAMKVAGADAVKVQTFLPEDMTLNLNKPMFLARKGTIWGGRSLFDLYKEASLPYEWHYKLKKIAEEIGLIFLSSPFSKSAVDLLDDIGVPAYKIASPEITDIPLIEYTASKGKPIILSSGIATLTDIELALNTCRQFGNNQLALLKCTTAYPAPFEEVNLRTIPDMINTFKVISGLSDHTLGVSIPIAAVALGAKIIEKHFILDRKLGGVDSKFSIEPHEFKQMVHSIREVELALGEITYDLTPKTIESRNAARSLFAVEDIKKGEYLTIDNIQSIRPGYGLHPKHYNKVLEQKAREFISKGTPLKWDLIEENTGDKRE
jgi:pseudaminic acid synthase